MYSTFSDNIIKYLRDSYHWTQSFIYINPDEIVIVKLTEAVGENAKVPSNAPDQPE